MVRRVDRPGGVGRVKETIIIADDREKDGWTSEYLGPGFKVVRKRLDTGDYTIKGMEDLVCIEKKSGWSEIAVNVGSKRLLGNFKAELERMGDFPIRYLVIHDDPSHIQHARTYAKHIGKNTILLWYLRIQLEYGVPVICAGSKKNAKNLIRQLFRKIIEHNRNGTLHHFGPNTNGMLQ